MIESVFLGVKGLFSLSWNLLRSIYIPGTNITPLSWLLFSSFAILFVKFLKGLLARDED